mmetsp:Transcript_11213/g.29995  ORF Transcript_11213/g.29995 Transcript_11213/m.29995 type:complete len:82 (-) Transcript_11213:1500-1745(-)
MHMARGSCRRLNILITTDVERKRIALGGAGSPSRNIGASFVAAFIEFDASDELKRIDEGRWDHWDSRCASMAVSRRGLDSC